MKTRFQMTLAVAVLIVSHANAQVLTHSGTSGQSYWVEQFGMPKDARYVFCQTNACPQRSLKHLALPVPPKMEIPAPPIVLPKSQAPEEVVLMSPAPKLRAKPIHKPLKRRKPKVDIDCKPTTKK